MADLFEQQKTAEEEAFERELAEMDLRRAQKRAHAMALRGETCQNCKHASSVTTENGYDTNFMRCVFVRQWKWFAPMQVCAFTPSRFARQTEQQAAPSATREAPQSKKEKPARVRADWD